MAQELGLCILVGLISWNLTGFSATIFAGYFRRHLMVWSVYAPKFLFAIPAMFGVEISISIFALGSVLLPLNRFRDMLNRLHSKKIE